METSMKAPVDMCTEKCAEHTGEIIQHYCKDHSCLACSICVTMKHQTCDVTYIHEASRDITSSDDYKEFAEDIKNIFLKSTSITSKSNQNISMAAKTRSQVLTDIQRIRREINDAFDTLEETMTSKSDLMEGEDNAKMNSTLEVSYSSRTEAIALASQIKTLGVNQMNCNLFVAMKRGEEKLKELNERLDKVDSANTVRSYAFRPSVPLEDFLRSIDHLGDLRQDDKKDKDTETLNTNISVGVTNGSTAPSRT